MTSLRWHTTILLLVWISIVTVPPTPAQITTGTITGLLTDQSGAPVPRASLQLTNVETGEVRTAATDATGEYKFTTLSVGEYRLRAALAGFQPVLRRDLRVRINETARVDITLRPGAVETVVEVTGAPPTLHAESGDLGGTIEHRAIVDLPLNGRNFVQLVALQPGGVPTVKIPGGGASFFTSITGGQFSVHGTPGGETDYLLDGIPLRDMAGPQMNYRITVDAIQEFKIQTVNYSAAFGRASGGIVNVASRSGGNIYHGDVWEFLRNDQLDARNFFDPLNQPEFRQNQFGGALGGPIVRDKLFSFVSYEGFRQFKQITRATSVPTVAQRNGDFTGLAPIFNPLAVDSATGLRQAFPGQQIPRAQWSPVSVRTLDRQYPLPDRPGNTNNLGVPGNQTVTENQVNVRTDLNLSVASRAFVRYGHLGSNRNVPYGDFSAVGLAKFINEFQRPATHAVIGESHTFGPKTVNEIRFGLNRAIQVSQDQEENVAVNKELGITGTSTKFQGNPYILVSGLSASGTINNAPNNRNDNEYLLLDNFSHIAGHHSLSTGFTLSWLQLNGGLNRGSSGNFEFNGIFSAQLTPTGTQAGTGNAVADLLLGYPFRTTRCCLATDGFRNWLKKEAGIYFQDDWKVRSNLTFNIGLRWEYNQPAYEKRDRASQPDYTKAPAAVLLFGGKNGVPRAIRPVDMNNFAPRFGFAYSHSLKTVVRGGYGIFYAPIVMAYASRMSNNAPFSDLEQFLSDTRRPQLTLADGFPTGLGIPSLAFGSVGLDLQDTQVQQWNIGVERLVFSSLTLSTSYVGTKGNKLLSVEDFNAPEAGPGAVSGRRPIPGFAADNRFGNRGKSIYHGLELKAERRFSSNLGLLAGFVWSKCIDTGGVQLLGDGSPSNERNPRDNSAMNRGLCQYDLRRRFNASFLYDIPFGAGLRGVAKTVASNWQLQGIVDLQDGQPFSALLTNDNSNTGRLVDHPDVRAGQDPNNGRKIPEQWFNVGAFASPAPFTYGNAGRNIITGPGFANLDLSLFKKFSITERHTVQFRAEFFNILNHTNFYQPGNKFATGTFGVISGAFEGRDIQFGLKYSF